MISCDALISCYNGNKYEHEQINQLAIYIQERAFTLLFQLIILKEHNDKFWHKEP